MSNEPRDVQHLHIKKALGEHPNEPGYITTIPGRGYRFREKDQALEWLDKAYEDRSFWFTRIKVDPRLDNCRSDPPVYKPPSKGKDFSQTLSHHSRNPCSVHEEVRSVDVVSTKH